MTAPRVSFRRPLSKEHWDPAVDGLGQFRIGLGAENRAISSIRVQQCKVAWAQAEEPILLTELLETPDEEADACSITLRGSGPQNYRGKRDAMIYCRKNEFLVLVACQSNQACILDQVAKEKLRSVIGCQPKRHDKSGTSTGRQKAVDELRKDSICVDTSPPREWVTPAGCEKQARSIRGSKMAFIFVVQGRIRRAERFNRLHADGFGCSPGDGRIA